MLFWIFHWSIFIAQKEIFLKFLAKQKSLDGKDEPLASVAKTNLDQVPVPYTKCIYLYNNCLVLANYTKMSLGLHRSIFKVLQKFNGESFPCLSEAAVWSDPICVLDLHI